MIPFKCFSTPNSVRRIYHRDSEAIQSVMDKVSYSFLVPYNV